MFSWIGMLIRSALAAIDFNSNIQRKTKMTADGRPRYKMKVGSLEPRLLFFQYITLYI